MKPINLKKFKGIIWDLDGTLYRYTPEFLLSCDTATALTVLTMGLSIPLDEAMAIAKESARLHGTSFILFAERHGLKYPDFHHPFHASIDETTLLEDPKVRQALESLQIPQVILTNASRKWVVRVLKHLKLDHIFGDRIVSLEDVNFQAKGSSDAGFIAALAKLGLSAEDVLMVEDLPRNLIIPKQMGMTTALVHQDDPADIAHAHVDYVFPEVLDLLRTLLNQEPEPTPPAAPRLYL